MTSTISGYKRIIYEPRNSSIFSEKITLLCIPVVIHSTEPLKGLTLIFNCLSKLLPNMFISLEQIHVFKTSIKTELIIFNAPIGEVVCLSNSRQELTSINLRWPQKTLNLHPQRKVSHFPGGQGPGARSSPQRAQQHKGCSSEPKEVWTVGQWVTWLLSRVTLLPRKHGEELCRSLHSQSCVRQAAGFGELTWLIILSSFPGSVMALASHQGLHSSLSAASSMSTLHRTSWTVQ